MIREAYAYEYDDAAPQIEPLADEIWEDMPKEFEKAE